MFSNFDADAALCDKRRHVETSSIDTDEDFTLNCLIVQAVLCSVMKEDRSKQLADRSNDYARPCGRKVGLVGGVERGEGRGKKELSELRK